MAKLKVEVMRDYWDDDGDRIASGTIVDMDHNLAAKFLKSGVVDIVVPDEPPKRVRPPNPVAPDEAPRDSPSDA